MKIKLFTYLKNTDLHCMSSYEAITNLLGYKKMKRIKRYGLWELELDTATTEAAIQKVEYIISSSYYISNPNKEAHYIEKVPQPVLRAGEQNILVKVDTPYIINEEQLIKKIAQKVGIKLKSISKSLIWELVIANNGSKDNLKDELAQKVLNTQNRANGLLVNPIHETYSFLEPESYYSK
jgi:phosphoribosylformylglycinamidine (FGAM) synthase PurS component